MPRPSFKNLMPYVALAFVYFITAKLGLRLAFVHPSATALWPPTGIAIAAFLILGYRSWPSILVAAFFANLLTAGNAATSLGIALGNTGEGLFAAYLVNRFAHGLHVFDHPLDIFKFVLFAAFVSPLISATCGIASLIMGGFAPWNNFGLIWLTWWAGDAGGALVVAPFLILWNMHPEVSWKRTQWLEALLLMTFLLITGLLIFHGGPKNNFPAILCLPAILWAALRFNQRETTAATLLFAGMAIMGTLHGLGPFARGIPLNEGLLMLQIYLGVMAITGLIISSVVSERWQAERDLRVTNDDLENRVNKRTESLSKAIQELQVEILKREWAEGKVRLYADIVHNMQIGIGVVHVENMNDPKSLRIIATNPGASRITGIPWGSSSGKTVFEVFPALYQTEIPKMVMSVAHSGQGQDIEEIRYGDEHIAKGVFSLKFFPLPEHCVGVAFENVTKRKRMEEALHAHEVRFRRLVDSNIIGFFTVNKAGKVLEANEAFLKMLGYTQDELAAGQVGGPDMTPEEYKTLDQWAAKKLDKEGVCPPMEKEYIRKDGSRIPVLVGLVRLESGGDRYLCFVIDVTERRNAQNALRKAYDEMEIRIEERTAELSKEIIKRREAEEALRSLSITDPLTGLYNRRGFLMLAAQHLKMARRNHVSLLLFMADLDDLKPINDQHGHPEGDHALIETAVLLKRTFRTSDVIARIGGDEFAVVVLEEHPHSEREIRARLQEQLDEHNRRSKRGYLLAASIGSARMPPDRPTTIENLMRQADVALYTEKRRRKRPLASSKNRHFRVIAPDNKAT